MNPFYFGTGQRRLFGIYEPARPGGTGTRVAVLCPPCPWDSEYMFAHRSVRRLAAMLGVAGFHTLRFDYFGTGDSAGDIIEADLKGWESDIESAMGELKDTTDATRVTLLGLCLGATLAARVAAKRPREVDALVLWDAVVSGEEYLQSQYQAHQRAFMGQPPPRPAEFGGGYEIMGFPLTARMALEFQAIDLAALVPALPVRTLVAASKSLPSHDMLRPMLAARSAGPLAIERIASQQAWVENSTDPGVLPVNVLQRIVQWLE
jgi:pimeloyl-ACP methyl ester carboxylesterase